MHHILRVACLSTILLMAGCAEPEASQPAPAEPPTAATAPTPGPGPTTEAAPASNASAAPIVTQVVLRQNCGALVGGIYLHCLDGADLAPTDFMHDVDVTNASRVVVEAELTVGDEAQLLARAGPHGSTSRQDWFQDRLHIALGPSDWSTDGLSIQLWPPEIGGVASTPVWAGLELEAEVTVSVFTGHVDTSDYCARC